MKYVRYLLMLAVSAAVIFIIAFVIKERKPQPTGTISPSATDFEKGKAISSFSLENAPSESLKGKITEMSGEIGWVGRVATEAAKITSPIEIQQGENLITGGDGSLSLTFLGSCIVDISENSEVDIIQTLPENIVFSQVNGTATYSTLGGKSISVRTSYLLTQAYGDAKIERDSENFIVTVSIITGEATFAYNDSKLVSHILKAKEGQIFTFNYGTRKGALE